MRIIGILAGAVMVVPLALGAQHMHGSNGQAEAGLIQGGQAGFTAVAEVKSRLDADPETDWNTVDIPALVDHLRDMDLVFSGAKVDTRELQGGVRYLVTGDAATAAALGRMTRAHGSTLARDWDYSVTTIANGVEVDITPPSDSLPRLKALGFVGFLADGDHHRAHHWAIATGRDPHH